LVSSFKLNADAKPFRARRTKSVDKKKLIIAIPASVISDTPHLREKTSKVGLIGRAAAIFRVDEIVVYRDDPGEKQVAELDLISALLSYMETPQYLRKRLFKIEPKLQYAGILPPLRTPHHPASGRAEDLKAGDYREGVVLSQAKEGLLVDIGVEKAALLREKQHALGERLTLQLVKVGGQVEVQAANRVEIPDYWGYVVTLERRSLKAAIEKANADLKVGTSRKGSEFADVSAELARKWKEAGSMLVVFGSPARGLHEIAADEGWQLQTMLDCVVNTVPCQGTETVRTEEALLATLAVLNLEFAC
jgi:predicted SPOUT superfamily RNA methylase MTH1